MHKTTSVFAGLVLAFGVVCFAPQPVCADTIQYNVTANNGGLNYQAGTGGNFTLPQFNPALGTLLSVLVEVTGYSIGGVNQIDNESATDAGNAVLTIGSTVTVISGADTLTIVVLPSETTSGAVTTDTDVAPNFAGTDFLGVSGTTSQDTESNAPGDVTPYIGAGNITFNFNSAGNTGINLTAPLDFLDLFGPNGLGINSVNPSYYIDATITYDYEPLDDPPTAVPEPGTLIMALVLGAMATPLARRKRASATR